MPKVHFVHENVTVEVDRGRRLSDIAKERGISVCRQALGWTGIGNYTVWVDGDAGATSPRTFWERLRGLKGWRRFANHTRVEGDVRVWTQQGIGSRLGGTRNIDALPNPTEDDSFVQAEHGAAGTAWCPYGHPSSVGEGKREPPKFEEKPKKAAPAKAAAKKDAPAKKAAPEKKPAATKAEAKEPAKEAEAKEPAKKAADEADPKAEAKEPAKKAADEADAKEPEQKPADDAKVADEGAGKAE